MKIEKVYTGSWFPRTKLHLQEFFNFLKYQSSDLELDQEKINSLYKILGIREVSYVGGTFDRVEVNCEKCDFEYFEDGLLVLGKKSKNIKEDFIFLEEYYQKKIVEVFNFIYSRGAPLPLLNVFSHIHRVRPFILTMSQGTEKEIVGLSKELRIRPFHAKVTTKDYQVYFSTKCIFVVSKKIKNEECLNLIRHYIFFREFEGQMHKFLNINRYLWDSVAEILKKETVRYKELPELREKLLDFKEQNTLIKNRIGQMDNYVLAREIEAKNLGYLNFLNKYKADRFTKAMSTHAYIVRLWRMTEESLGSATDLINSLYQENTQKELTTLQAIFMVGVVASFITLGSMPGAYINFFQPNGSQIARGEFISFDFITMLKFGFTALAFSLAIYFLWGAFFKNIRKFKVISIIKSLKK